MIDKNLESAMDLARKATEEGHAKRRADNKKVKIPVGNLSWSSEQDFSSITKVDVHIWDIVLKELNAKNITISDKLKYPDPPVTFSEEELQKEGELRELVREIQAERKKLNCKVTDKVNVTLPAKYKDDIEAIQRKVLADTVTLGEKLEVTTV